MPDHPVDSWTPERALAQGIDAVQEEFDELGLGEADLVVKVILEESGYQAERDRLRAENERLRWALKEIGHRCDHIERDRREPDKTLINAASIRGVVLRATLDERTIERP